MYFTLIVLNDFLIIKNDILIMANLFDIFKQNLDGDLLNQLDAQVGINNPEKTKTAAEGAFSILMGALQKNASTDQGASVLSSVLDRDHDGSILDDIMGYISGSAQTTNSRTVDGAGILSHLLGGKSENILAQVANMAGIDTNSSAGLLMKLAPIAMGLLGKAKKENNLDHNGIRDILTQTVEPVKENSMFGGLLNNFLDQDGDGDIMDDLGRMGVKAIFKGFFGGK